MVVLAALALKKNLTYGLQEIIPIIHPEIVFRDEFVALGYAGSVFSAGII